MATSSASAPIADAQPLADRQVAGQELTRDVGPEHADRRRDFHVGRPQELAGTHLPLPDDQQVGRRAQHRYLALEPARERHLQHLGDLLELVLEVLGDFLQPHQVVATGHVHEHDGPLGEVELEDLRLFGFLGKVRLRQVHLVAHLLEGVVDVDAGVELDGNR